MQPRYRLLLSAAVASLLLTAALLHLGSWFPFPPIAWVLPATGAAVVLLLVHHFAHLMDAATWGKRFEQLALWGAAAAWIPLAVRMFGLHYLPFRYRWLLIDADRWPQSIQWALFWAEQATVQHFLGAALLIGLGLMIWPTTRRWGAALTLLAALPGGLTAWFFQAGPAWIWALPAVPVAVWSFDTRTTDRKPALPLLSLVLLLVWTTFAVMPAFQEPKAPHAGRYGVVDFYSPGMIRPQTLIWDLDQQLLLQYPNGSLRLADVQWSKDGHFVAQWRVPVEEQGQSLHGTWNLDSLDQAYELRGTWNGQKVVLRAVRE